MVIQVDVLWISSSFPSHFFLQFSKNGLIPMPHVHEKSSTEKTKRGDLGKTDPQKGQTKNEMSNFNFGFRNVFSVWTWIRFMDISWQNRTPDLAKCCISKTESDTA